MNHYKLQCCLLLCALTLLLTTPTLATTWVHDSTIDLPNGNDQIELSISIDTVSEAVDFEVTGPATRWFGTGYGATFMSNTYAIIMYPNGTVQERILGNHNAGAVPAQSVQMANRVDNGNGTATFTFSRALDPNVAGVFPFPADGSSVNMIRAVGSGASLSYHGFANKSVGTIAFEEGVVSGVDDRPLALAAGLRNVPNPFNPMTEFRFNLARSADVEVRIYDVRGRSVATLTAGTMSAGAQALTWRGQNDAGNALNSGVYFYRLLTDGRDAGRVGKMSLLK